MRELDFAIERYTNIVRDLINNRSDLFIPNEHPYEAAIALMALFEITKKEILIYDNALNGDIADIDSNFCLSISKLLSENKSIKMVLRKEEHSETEIYKQLRKLSRTCSGNLDIRVASKEFRDHIQDYFGVQKNFAVADRTAFRIETEKNVYDAICCFNNKVMGADIANQFNAKFSTCERFKFGD